MTKTKLFLPLFIILVMGMATSAFASDTAHATAALQVEKDVAPPNLARHVSLPLSVWASETTAAAITTVIGVSGSLSTYQTVNLFVATHSPHIRIASPIWITSNITRGQAAQVSMVSAWTQNARLSTRFARDFSPAEPAYRQTPQAIAVKFTIPTAVRQ
jgi:hypothetical protein